ncbi:hypothetical protein [Hydrogenophaga sp.]|uniref:hypothetical protein n=1 Tax=Hydrogenophaga sp. TaxID=1904254 RepID=UPI003F7299FA
MVSTTEFRPALVLTAAGSAWHHCAPDPFGLALDRLGMAVSFAGAIALAKLLEMGDEIVFHATGDTVSGHSLKHVAAAFAVWPVWSALRQNPRALGRTLASVAQ